MTGSTPNAGDGPRLTPTDLASALASALQAHSCEAFTQLLTYDVHWGTEHGGVECTDRAQATEHYARLLASGASIILHDISEDGDGHLTATIAVTTHEPNASDSAVTVRLTVRSGLIADIRELDSPPTIEVLFFDGCPHYEQYVPHLRQLLTEHGVTASLTLTRVDDDEQAQAHRFLGSPTVRINGRDVDLTSHGRTTYGMQCRLYAVADGATGTPPDQWILDALIPNPDHEAAITAIHNGDVDTLRRILDQRPDLAQARLAHHGARTLLHIATDWPGHFPNVTATIATLIEAGADPDSASLGEHAETPLHWAASSGDLEAITALLDHGADINATGAVIGGGTPMADATAFGQWDAAQLLLVRGARTNLFEAAALGQVEAVRQHLIDELPTPQDLASSFWGACHGGHLNTATVLLDHGADVNWIGYDHLTPLDAAQRSQAHDLTAWLSAHGTRTAADLAPNAEHR